MFKVPKLNGKHHIVGYQPSGQSGTARHAVLYECAAEAGADGGRWDNWSNGEGFLTFDMPREWSSCISPVAAWAIGSKGTYLHITCSYLFLDNEVLKFISIFR